MQERKDQETLERLVTQSMDGIAQETREQAVRGEQGAEGQDKRERQKRIAAFIVIPVALLLTAINTGSLGALLAPHPPAVLPEGEPIRPAMLEILNDSVEELEEYRSENGRYPARPDFLGPADATDSEDGPFVYEPEGLNGYTLSFTLDGETITYDSSEDPDVFFAGVRR